MSNLDEDHVSDLPNIDRLCVPNRFYTNSTISPDYVVYKKNEGGGLGPGITQAVAYMRRFTALSAPIDYGLEIRTFEHRQGLFDDFNNLSVVTFLFYAGQGIIFPGDIEQRAWHVFLADQEFRRCLARTNLFVASHHGRENGLEPTVFDYCHPELILISDKSIRHQTQLTTARYGAYAGGVMFGRTRRDVLTTRNDGTISITIQPNGQGQVNTSG